MIEYDVGDRVRVVSGVLIGLVLEVIGECGDGTLVFDDGLTAIPEDVVPAEVRR